MVICGFGDKVGNTHSDVYIYKSGQGNYVSCTYCALDGKKESQIFESVEDVEKHLNEHVKAGHKVPQHAWINLKKLKF